MLKVNVVLFQSYNTLHNQHAKFHTDIHFDSKGSDYRYYIRKLFCLGSFTLCKDSVLALCHIFKFSCRPLSQLALGLSKTVAEFF